MVFLRKHDVCDGLHVEIKIGVAEFYANPDLRNVMPPSDETGGLDVGMLIEQLWKSPNLANALAQALK